MSDLRGQAEDESPLSLRALAQAYLWRLAVYVLAAAAAGAWLAHRACGLRWRWAVPCGLLSATLVFGLAWVVVSPAWMPLASPVAIGGVPAAAWATWRRRSWRQGALAAAAWLAAALPAAVLSANWW